MNRLRIAQTVHLAIAAVCMAIGDPVNPPWDQCTDSYRQGMLSGVDMHLANPDTTPEQTHEAWLAARVADGWVWGEKKDADAKTHPCIKPWAELPEAQRVKDHVFKALVAAIKDVPDAVVEAAAVQTLMATPDGFVPVKYVGRRDTYRETTYATGLVFARGQTHMVPADKARLMLRHPDVYAPGDVKVAEPAPALGVGTKAEQSEEDKTQDARDVIAAMDKNALEVYARNNFRVDLDRRKGIAKLREEVTQLVDRFGAPEA